jgi:hypothetical protein
MKRWLVPLALAAAWCALILLVHRDSPRTLVSAHGLLHAAIAGEFADGASRPPLATPPEDPLFAGEPLRYYYFFHAVGARVAALLGLDPIHAFELLILLAAAVVVLVGFRIGGWIHSHAAARRAYGIAFALLFFAGCNPQAPLVLLARWLKDGGESLADRGQYLWGLVHPINGAMRIADWWGSLGPLVVYFFNVTARPLALATLACSIALLAPSISASARRRQLALLGLAAASALCTLWSPLLGLAAAAALSAALVFEAIRWNRPGRIERWLREHDPETRPEVVGNLVRFAGAEFRGQLLGAAALLAGAALAWPWYRHLLGGAAGELSFGFDARRAIGVVASCWLVALLAAVSPRWFRAEAGSFVRVLRLAGLLLAIPTAFVALPVDNEDNFLHAALVCWSFVAASAAVPDSRREPQAAPKPDGGAG